MVILMQREEGITSVDTTPPLQILVLHHHIPLPKQQISRATTGVNPAATRVLHEKESRRWHLPFCPSREIHCEELLTFFPPYLEFQQLCILNHCQEPWIGTRGIHPRAYEVGRYHYSDRGVDNRSLTIFVR